MLGTSLARQGVAPWLMVHLGNIALGLLSLGLSTAFIVADAVIGPTYFVEPRQLFPIWPEWDAHSAIGFAVWTGTAGPGSMQVWSRVGVFPEGPALP